MENAKKIIREFEGLKLKAYKCPAGIWTIGYGHTKGVASGQVIDNTAAEQFLDDDAEEALQGVRSCVTVDLTENQEAALVSFVFNLGVGSLRKSTLLKLLNAGQDPSDEFIKWNKASGVVLNGLTRRREAETGLWRLQA